MLPKVPMSLPTKKLNSKSSINHKNNFNFTNNNNNDNSRKRQEVAMDIANRITNLLSKDLGASVYEDAFINFSLPELQSESGQTTTEKAPVPAVAKTTNAPAKSGEASSSTTTPSVSTHEAEPHKFTVFIFFFLFLFLYLFLSSFHPLLHFSSFLLSLPLCLLNGG